MGITFDMIEKMFELNLLKPNCKIMDIGTSNLYLAPAKNVVNLLTKFIPYTSELDDYAARLEYGAHYDAIAGGRNISWAGDFFEKCGLSYSSIDIAKGYKTTVFDLNTEQAPQHWKDNFDLVLNFGTTEHVFNQSNAFNTIHNMTKKNAFIMHQLPISGYADHGYFIYTTRFFVDMAYRNNYKICHVNYTSGGPISLFEYPKNVIKYHPAFEIVNTLKDITIDNYGLTIVFQKTTDDDFVYNKDLSTSVTL